MGSTTAKSSNNFFSSETTGQILTKLGYYDHTVVGIRIQRAWSPGSSWGEGSNGVELCQSSNDCLAEITGQIWMKLDHKWSPRMAWPIKVGSKRDQCSNNLIPWIHWSDCHETWLQCSDRDQNRYVRRAWHFMRLRDEVKCGPIVLNLRTTSSLKPLLIFWWHLGDNDQPVVCTLGC